MSLNTGIAIAIGAGLAFSLGHGATGLFHVKRRNRWGAYIVCGLGVFFLSVAFGSMMALPVEPGDEIGERVQRDYRKGMSLAERDALIQKIFLIALIPALLGVRLALEPDE